MNTEALSLTVTPRDGFFCKDGRGWYTSAANRTASLHWPFPNTLRGALCTSLGLELQQQRDRALNKEEWLELHRSLELHALLPLRRPLEATHWEPSHRMWPFPADAVYLEVPRAGAAEAGAAEAGAAGAGAKVDRRVCRLRPTERRAHIGLAGGTDDPALEGLWHPQLERPAGWVGKPKPLPHPVWWDEHRFLDWLCQAPVSAGDDRSLELSSRTDIRLSVDPATQAARDGMLFSIEVIEMLGKEHAWTIAVKGQLSSDPSALLPNALNPNAPPDALNPNAVLPNTPLPNALRLGGKHRLAWIEQAGEPLWSCPKSLIEAFDTEKPRGIRLFMATPGHFRETGWLPSGLKVGASGYTGTLLASGPELELKAAVVPRPQHVSGWDMTQSGGRGGPRTTRRLVPAGSVYFLTRADGGTFSGDDARALWMAQLGDDTADGFGCVVPGLWTPFSTQQ